MAENAPGRLRPPHRAGGPRCRTCGVPLFPEEKDYCAAHATSRIDNTGTAEELAERERPPGGG